MPNSNTEKSKAMWYLCLWRPCPSCSRRQVFGAEELRREDVRKATAEMPTNEEEKLSSTEVIRWKRKSWLWVTLMTNGFR